MLKNDTLKNGTSRIGLYGSGGTYRQWMGRCTVLEKYAHIGLTQNYFLRSTTLDIITRLLDNAAFVCGSPGGKIF